MAVTYAKRRKKKRIFIKPSKRGSLRKATGTSEGENIPFETLQRLKRSKSGAMRKKANFALNARKFRH